MVSGTVGRDARKVERGTQMPAIIKVDVTDAISKLGAIRTNQLPYATSRALNDTALAAREARAYRLTCALSIY